MAIGAFVRRDLIVATRRKTVFADRLPGVVVPALVFFGGAALADYQGWDRRSVAGTRRFAVAVFELSVLVQWMFASGLMATLVAPAIARERDRKTLDAVLATRATSAEVVLGAVLAGLWRYANAVLPVVPAVLLFLPVDPRLVLVGFAGITSTAVLLAAVAVAVSARARTGNQATQVTVTLFVAWLWLPLCFVLILPRALPSVARWTTPLCLPLLDSSPLGVGLSLSGVLPRRSLVDGLLRMIAYQAAASVLLLFWTIVRLRAAARAVYDGEGRSALRRLLGKSTRSRPPCGDDPVLWREIYSSRAGRRQQWLGHALNAAWMGLFAYVVSWFAWPAFVELLRSGYGAGRDAAPGIHPLARMMVFRFSGGGVAAESARLEFNGILRQASAVISLIYVLVLAGTAAESIVVERERDTWSGLIATPLTGREILRAKVIGIFWKARVLWIPLLTLWGVGLLAGSLHPLGLILTVAGFAVWSWLLLAIGICASLWGRDRNQATNWALFPLLLMIGLAFAPFGWPGMGSVLLGGFAVPFQIWEALLSYEDVRAAWDGRASFQLASVGIADGLGLGGVAILWLAGVVTQAAGARLLWRAACRGFDRAVGRPVPKNPGQMTGGSRGSKLRGRHPRDPADRGLAG